MKRPRIRLRPELVVECRRYARERIKPENISQWSRAVSILPGSSEDFETQLNGKLRECAACLYFGVPSSNLNWDPGKSDKFDLVVGPCRIDVKGSHLNAVLLPYSVGRTTAGLYAASEFTHLLLVRGSLEDEAFELTGWITKENFFINRQVAPDGHPRAAKWIPGTWYVTLDQLNEDIDAMFAGYVGDDGYGHHLQYCYCGRVGPFGYGRFARAGKPGVAYCAEHKPK